MDFRMDVEVVLVRLGGGLTNKIRGYLNYVVYIK